MSTGSYKKLYDAAVPSIFSFKCGPSKHSRSRSERAAKRLTAVNTPLVVDDDCTVPQLDIGSEVDVVTESASEQQLQEQQQCSEESFLSDNSVQCSLLSERWSAKQFRCNSVAIHYYTGLDDYEHFQYFLAVLGPGAEHLTCQYNILPVEDQLFLTLMKLRQAKDDVELSILFGCSAATVSRLIKTWINFMYYQLKEINIWPSQNVIRQHMPSDFGRKFGNTRVILDATECAVEKPANLSVQSSTFSTYKNCNTVKTIIGCTPHGAVSFISDTYGGCTSDRQIIERSQLCSDNSMFSAGDSIMADRGLMVQDLFAPKNVLVNTPHMLKGKSQLEPAQVVNDRRVASKRIHIERVIGLAKTFKILDRKLPIHRIMDAGKIVFICVIITNFRNCIVGHNA